MMLHQKQQINLQHGKFRHCGKPEEKFSCKNFMKHFFCCFVPHEHTKESQLRLYGTSMSPMQVFLNIIWFGIFLNCSKN